MSVGSSLQRARSDKPLQNMTAKYAVEGLMQAEQALITSVCPEG